MRNPTTLINVVETVHVRSVSPGVIPKTRPTSQKPLSLTWLPVVAPAAIAMATSPNCGAVRSAIATIGAVRPADVIIATVELP